jgi:hypothetical protein
MVQGHLSDLERKSNEPIALAFSGVESVRNVAIPVSDKFYSNANR